MNMPILMAEKFSTAQSFMPKEQENETSEAATFAIENGNTSSKISLTHCEGSSFISLRNALLNFRFKSSALSYFFINMSELKRGQVLEREEEQR